jgi:hypothetical protein
VRKLLGSLRLSFEIVEVQGEVKANSYRHLAMPYRRTRRQSLRRIDDGVGVHAVVAVEVADGAGLAEMRDVQRYPRFDLPILEPHSSAPNMMEYNKKKKPNIKIAMPIIENAKNGKDFTPCSERARKVTRIPTKIMREKIAIGTRCFIFWPTVSP